MTTVLDDFESDIAFENTGNIAITNNLHTAANENFSSACIGAITKEYDTQSDEVNTKIKYLMLSK